jgi:hypothetical protein
MSLVSSQVLALARRIAMRETLACEQPEQLAAGLARIFQGLHAVAANMIGDFGYHALLSRAQRLTRADYPGLPDCSPTEGEFPRGQWDPFIASLSGPIAIEAATSLAAHVLSLLANFLGEDFTFRLARRAWPDEYVSAKRSGPGET